MSQETLEKLQKRIDEIDATFKPSTTKEDGELLLTNYDKWNSEVYPKQEQDWDLIWNTLLKGYKKHLLWQHKGWIFNHYKAKYNWRGWGITEGIALDIPLPQK